jgi:hypothetical protein
MAGRGSGGARRGRGRTAAPERGAVTGTSPAAGESGKEPDHVWLYAGVIVVEVIVLACIWMFQRYFGS